MKYLQRRVDINSVHFLTLTFPITVQDKLNIEINHLSRTSIWFTLTKLNLLQEFSRYITKYISLL